MKEEILKLLSKPSVFGGILVFLGLTFIFVGPSTITYDVSPNSGAYFTSLDEACSEDSEKYLQPENGQISTTKFSGVLDVEYKVCEMDEDQFNSDNPETRDITGNKAIAKNPDSDFTISHGILPILA